jgi:hypothetical protein
MSEHPTVAAKHRARALLTRDRLRWPAHIEVPVAATAKSGDTLVYSVSVYTYRLMAALRTRLRIRGLRLRVYTHAERNELVCYAEPWRLAFLRTRVAQATGQNVVHLDRRLKLRRVQQKRRQRRAEGAR